MKEYLGSCHCGSVSFSFEQKDNIDKGIKCNCSICKRKGAVMSEFTLSPDELEIKVDGDNLGLYQFNTKIAEHYFCKTCGIYPFHVTMRKPGHYRVNLGCVDGVDTFDMDVSIFDGKSI